MSQDKPYIWESPWKLLGWAQNLCGAKPQGITRMEQTMWARLMECQIRCPPASSGGGGLRKGTIASASTSAWEKAIPPVLTLLPDNSVPPHMSLVPAKLLPLHWSSEGVSLSRSVCRAFRRNCLHSRIVCLPQPRPPLVFTVRSYGMGTCLPHTGTLSFGAWCGAGHLYRDPLLARYPSQFLSPTHGCGTSPFCIFTPPTSLDVVSSLISSVIVGLPFSSVSDGSEWWLFCSCYFDVVMQGGKPCLHMLPSCPEVHSWFTHIVKANCAIDTLGTLIDTGIQRWIRMGSSSKNSRVKKKDM